MSRVIQSYVNGAWILPSDVCRPVVNPATGKEIAQVSMGTADTVNSAVQAARAAFVEFSDWTVEARIALLERISAAYEKRIPDLAEAITAEMGSPISFSRAV
jgi:aldehyde dehydrogenase (NAD+)